jgi:hypothetical protein
MTPLPNKIIAEAKEILTQLKASTNMLSHDEYTQKIGLLSQSSIGEHTRHIIELFQQLLKGYESGNIEYDNRERNKSLQENTAYAIAIIDQIIHLLDKEDKELYIHTDLNSNQSTISSNYYREVMYNIEHCVHHQAIIKIAFLHLGNIELEEHFGVAKSTIKYRENCVQ